MIKTSFKIAQRSNIAINKLLIGFKKITFRNMPRARPGWEWLLTALLVYLNYHLLHRLYRTVAFYKMHDVWHLKYDQLNDGNISYQDTFKMAPENMASHLSDHGT